MFGPPEATSRAHTEGVRVWFEPVPESITRKCEIVVNPIARDILHPSLYHLLDAADITSKLVMSVQPENGQYAIHVSKSYGRSAPIMYGVFPMEHAVGGLIMAKSTFVSGDWYRAWVQNDDRYSQTDPLGFFGDKNALSEMRRANAHIIAGIRCAFPYAYVIYPDSILDWMFEMTPDKRLRQQIERSYSVLEANGERLTGLLRITGTVERYSTLYPHLFSFARQNEDIRRGAALLLMENDMEQSLTMKYLIMLGKRKARTVVDTLSTIRDGKKISLKQFDSYVEFLSAMNVSNGKGYLRLRETEKQTGSHEHISPNRLSSNDVDCAHLKTDHEAEYWGGSVSDAVFLEDLARALTHSMSSFIATGEDWRDYQYGGDQAYGACGGLLSFVGFEDRVAAMQMVMNAGLKERFLGAFS